MPRPLKEIVAHIRMVIANPNVSTTLIQTEDLAVLCDAAECPDCGIYPSRGQKHLPGCVAMERIKPDSD
jgi:hypothetical protein